MIGKAWAANYSDRPFGMYGQLTPVPNTVQIKHHSQYLSIQILAVRAPRTWLCWRRMPVQLWRACCELSVELISFPTGGA